MQQFKVTVTFEGISHEWTVLRPVGTIPYDVQRDFTNKHSVYTVESVLLPDDDEDPYEWRARTMLAELDALRARLDEEQDVDQMRRNALGIDIYRRCQKMVDECDSLSHETAAAGLGDKFAAVVSSAKAIMKRVGQELFGIGFGGSDGPD